MKSLLTCLVLSCSWFVPMPSLATEKDKSALVANDSLGGVKLSQKPDAVAKLIGEPASKGKEVQWEATGDWVEEWSYPALGLKINMGATSKGGAKTVLSISATAPCKLATARGIKIGSALAEVSKAYKDAESKEGAEPGKTFVAGSIYGGVIFSLKDGKVTDIFIGAGARSEEHTSELQSPC